ncbi:hypothetical protein EVAR_13676_1 [Eumeta japonica]|uniref:Uncharacterized protein n=1 Tax=Eumeta variegata TaxID=151549 RepID=A0A4C1UBD7_EUMVA|nr:hypothetical protein EVAR_13676_1 [Eumeta japonica]
MFAKKNISKDSSAVSRKSPFGFRTSRRYLTGVSTLRQCIPDIGKRVRVPVVQPSLSCPPYPSVSPLRLSSAIIMSLVFG